MTYYWYTLQIYLWYIVVCVSELRITWCTRFVYILICRDYHDDEQAAIWFIKCTDVSDDDPCVAYKYKDNLDLSSLAAFLRGASQPVIVR